MRSTPNAHLFPRLELRETTSGTLKRSSIADIGLKCYHKRKIIHKTFRKLQLDLDKSYEEYFFHMPDILHNACARIRRLKVFFFQRKMVRTIT